MDMFFWIGLITIITINIVTTILMTIIKHKNSKEINALYSCLISTEIITLIYLIAIISNDHSTLKDFITNCLSCILYEIIFYPINLLTIVFINKLKSKKINKHKNSINIPLLSIVIPTTLIFCIGIIMFTNYKKAELKEKNELEQLRLKYNKEETQRFNLLKCITEADTNRTDLWEANCPDDDKNCTLSQKTVEWIDDRYEQEIYNCNILYN